MSFAVLVPRIAVLVPRIAVLVPRIAVLVPRIAVLVPRIAVLVPSIGVLSVCLMGAAESVAAQAEQAQAEQDAFVGTYQITAQPLAEQNRNAAIETAIRDMSIGTNIARRRLAATTPVPSSISVTEAGSGRLRVKIDGAYDLSARPDGQPFEFEDEFGYEHTARLYLRANMLVITLRGHGDCRIELRFRPDRSSVRYIMRIHSDRLPADVRYQATYRRQAR